MTNLAEIMAARRIRIERSACPGYAGSCGVQVPIERALCFFCTRTKAQLGRR